MWKIVVVRFFFCRVYFLVKIIRCNLTKASQIFATFTDSLCKNMGILP